MINIKYCTPIKNRSKNIPDTLIYKSVKIDNETQPYSRYTAFNKNGKILGIIDGTMETIHPIVGNPFFPGLTSFKSFYIAYIKSHQQNFGNKLLDFVQTISRQNGGNGRFHLIATARFNPEKPAHIFYRKYGLDSLFREGIKQIDACINGKIPISDLEPIDMPMYFIPGKTNQKLNKNNKNTFINKILKLFKNKNRYE